MVTVMVDENLSAYIADSSCVNIVGKKECIVRVMVQVVATLKVY